MKDYCLITGLDHSSKMRLRQYSHRTKGSKIVCFGVYILRWNEKTQKYITRQINRRDVLIYYLTPLTKSLLRKLDLNSHLLTISLSRRSKERTRKWFSRHPKYIVRYICYGAYILRYTKHVSMYAKKYLKDPDTNLYLIRKIAL